MQECTERRSIRSNICRWNGGKKSDHRETSFFLDYQLELTPGEQEAGWKQGQGFGEERPWDTSLAAMGNHQVGPVVHRIGLCPSFQCHWWCGYTNKEIKKTTLKNNGANTNKIAYYNKKIPMSMGDYCELDFQGFIFPKFSIHWFQEETHWTPNPLPFSSQPAEGSGISFSSCAPLGRRRTHPKISSASQNPSCHVNAESLILE